MGTKGGVIYSELSDITPVYCSGVASVHLDRGNLHIAYYRDGMTADGTLERVIVFRLIVPEVAVGEGRRLVDFEIAVRKHVSGAMVVGTG